MKNNSTTQKHYRSCNLCEAICGIVIEHQNGEILSIKGDKEDPFSKGHICPKALALQDIYNHPDRLKQPLQKTRSGWKQISWKDAYQITSDKIKEIQAQHGNDAIAFYQGNPSVHNYGTMLFSGNLRKALRTKNNYSATSLDQLPHQYVAQLMFGHPLMIPVPDIDRTDYFLIIGANPMASNGSIMTAPGVSRRIKAIQKRGGKVVVVDPRKTETAKKADQHIFIKPVADVYLLLALIYQIFEQKGIDLKSADKYCVNLDAIENICKEYSPKKISDITGIDSNLITTLASEFMNANTAVCYGRMGVSVQEYGTICQWLINVLNIITGNLDSSGGHMFPNPAVQIRRGKNRIMKPRWYSRVSKKPEFMGELPTAVLAEEITTEGKGKIRGLVVSAGNPVVSSPNGKELAKALEQLDFMVSIDIYKNETSQYADLILPPLTGLEVDHYDLAFYNLSVQNVAKYSPALYEPAPNTQFDWQIFKELSNRISPPKSIKAKLLNWWQTPTKLLNIGLRTGPYKLSLKQLKKNPHGVDLSPLTSMLPTHLFTKGKKINLAPKILLEGMKLVATNFRKDSSSTLKLISRRHVRSNNSWMGNIKRLKGGSNKCTLQMNPKDAERLGDGELVLVKSTVGSIKVVLEITDDMMPGVVSILHGSQPNNNELTDLSKMDPITGNAIFSGIDVEVKAI
ncbi:MAG: dehydrogenase [Flavobacteriaceae bacterium]|nr:MAG: dehydrogenase [Flavobacteriaceae bacterium]